ncbi:hypothetical protein BWQ96_09770 [Gracilariopsis chorda]|uniref:Protein takeout n=1 Tax=Gracilariopsis chorda TaxID=448386 RepID=A0A2V3IEL9_9FLOR|nr:hypothetical protein BWQ96_09770 [Gracilariopsis chorda]|eukprot:PXF40517.1 hypothetical protein BWQ96_09770 [Gracilariopsis chorda]
MQMKFSVLVFQLLFLVSGTGHSARVYGPKRQVNPHWSTLSIPQSGKQISAEVLECSTSNPLKRALCQVVARKVNSSLADAGIQIDRNGLLFSFDDRTHQRIDTGHSCSVTAEIRRKQATARFLTKAHLDFDYGSALSEPVVLSVKVPIRLEAKADLKQRFGAKVFGRCKRLGSDSFSVEAKLSTTADVLIGLTLNPSFLIRPSGEFVVTVKPVAAVLFDFGNTDLDFEVKGLSYVTSLVGPLLGFTSSLTEGITDLFDGRGVKDMVRNFEDSVLFDLGIPILSRVDNLPRAARDLIFNLLSDVGQREVEKRAEGYGSDFEKLINSKIRSAVRADSNGVREFVVSGEILHKIDTASIEDILL